MPLNPRFLGQPRGVSTLIVERQRKPSSLAVVIRGKVFDLL